MTRLALAALSLAALLAFRSAPQEPPPLQQSAEQTKPVEESQEQPPAEADRPRLEDEEAESAAQGGVFPQTADAADVDAALAALGPVVDYDIRVTLKPKTKKLHGFLTLKYTNHSPDFIPDLQFHLYPNAFKNMSSTYMRERGRKPYVDDPWSYLRIRALRVDGEDRANDFVYLQTPHGQPGDQTVIQVMLRQPLAPGQSSTVNFEFETKLGRIWDRSGYDGDFFFVAQWFPKIGVWETKGHRGAERAGWNCHSFHANTEFYANFGSYKTRIETPKGFQVGATGKLIAEEEREDEVWRTFQQDRVHDFAFVAGRDLIVEKRTFDPDQWVTEDELKRLMVLHDASLEEARLNPVEMILLIQPQNRGQIDRHFEAMSVAIKYYGLWYGPYPYETITMVDPSFRGMASGGMEYPTLTTLGVRAHNPRDRVDFEDLVAHEFGHQYWYGMVATNEVEEAFLDEGFTTYSSAKIIDAHYGPKPQYIRQFRLYLPLSRWLGLTDASQMEMTVGRAVRDSGRDPIATHGYAYRRGAYGSNSYSKPATVLAQLENELGEETMARVMRTYFQRWSFKHPSLADFARVVDEVSGRDMAWFFKELFYEPGTVDYRVGRVYSRRYDLGSGYRDGPDGPVLAEEDSKAEPEKVRYVEILRDGEIAYPVDALVVFDDGREERKRWDAAGYWTRFAFQTDASIVKVVIDPDRKLLIEKNRANNAYFAEPDRRASSQWFSRLTVAAQHALQAIAGGF